MARVDPYIIKIPAFFANHEDVDVRQWFNYDNLWKHDIWVRTGGGTDLVEEGVSTETETITQTSTASSDSQGGFNAITITSNYTANDYDFVNAKQGARITFPQFPQQNSVIIIRNGDGSGIRLDGNGKNINGSSTGSLTQQETSIEFYYFIESDEWFAK